MNQQMIEDVVEQAQLAFWQEVAKSFPEIKTGDLPPDASVEFDEACKKVVQIWLASNS
ncbi:MAG TPA: hypothetical protein VM577_15000 [Anaerovoracaceae bacterium]|nr:hypothetical protein [Anaerovoracaceae bacterium]